MRIAICDDEGNVRSLIRMLIEKQDGDNIITEYSSGAELLSAINDSDGKDTDLIFLDIAMKNTDGMSVAKKIRKRQEINGQPAWGSLPLIIFVTGLSEYMPKAFSVNAFQFIEKPIDETKFDNVFKHALNEYRHIQKKNDISNNTINVDINGVSRTVRIRDIIYIESVGHKNIICMQNIRLEYYGRLNDLEQELKPDFFRIHRGYLINLNRIDHYDRTDVYMNNDDRLAISRYKYQEFVNAYLKHIS